MALINLEQTPVEKAVRAIKSASSQFHSVSMILHQEIFNALWNTAGADPQDILNHPDIGTDAASLFHSGALAVELILTQNPNALTTEQYMPKRAATPNSDGTVTLAPAED